MKKFNCASFFNTFFCDKKKKLLLIFIPILIFGLLVAFTLSANLIGIEELKSVEFVSDNWQEAEKPEDLVQGSWKVVKSAEWTSVKSAKITFDVTTAIKLSEHKKDVIFVLDLSGSMRGEKLSKLQQDASELAEYILQDSENTMSVISFSTKSQILTGEEGNYFTNDSAEVLDILANLEAKGGTNYAAALRNVSRVVDGYVENPNRDLVVMFLTDGYPAEESPAQIKEYLLLKENYPFMEINGVQYEMNTKKVIDQIEEISDNQYIAYKDNLKNILMEATLRPGIYEEFKITDYINDKYFELSSEDDIEVNLGNVNVDLSSQKVEWDLSNILVSGNKAQMVIDVNLKEPYNSIKDLYPTNDGEDLKLKLESMVIDKHYDDTPVLKNNFDVVYQTNAPEGCNIKVEETKNYFIYENVKITDSKPICSGYIFKGWEVVEDDVEKINDAEFIMPTHKVTIGGQWTKVGVNKSFDGNIIVKTTLWKQIQSDYLNNSVIDKGAKIYAGTENDEYPIYYYNYGNNVESDTYKHKNYVYYAGYCWKIVRTTETGGVKLLYYGTWEDNTCKAGIALDVSGTEIKSSFNSSYSSLSYVGYMYDKIFSFEEKDLQYYDYLYESARISDSSSYYYGDDIKYVDGKYELQNARLLQWADYHEELNGYYMCYSYSNVDSSCTSVRYIIDATRTANNNLIYLTLKNGQILEDINIELKFSEKYVENGDGTYSLDEYTLKTIKLLDFYTNADFYEKHYMCADKVSIRCSKMYYITYFGGRYGGKGEYQYYYIKSDKYKFGNDYKINKDGKYELVDTDISPIMEFWNWRTNYEKLGKNHYTCWNESGICDSDEIYYIFYLSSVDSKYIILTDGKKIEEFLNGMIGYENYEGSVHIDINQKDSVVKTNVELWYERNIKDTEAEQYLENTIFCNDRRISDLNGFDPNGTEVSDHLYFYSSKNNDLTCENLNDKFTVNDIYGKFSKIGDDTLGDGNGKLKYPIALLTKGEYNIMGYGNAYYKGYYWTLSPYRYEMWGNPIAQNYWINDKDSHEYYGYYVTTKLGIKPVVSLKNSTEYINAGDGTITNPYKIGSTE